MSTDEDRRQDAQFEKDILKLDEFELRRRLRNSRDYHRGFARCLDDLPIPRDCDCGIDGCRDRRDIRGIVEKLLKKVS